MASIATTAFTPFCRKRNRRAAAAQVILETASAAGPSDRRQHKDRVGDAMRQWTNERADADLTFTPVPPSNPEPEAAPDAQPGPNRHAEQPSPVASEAAVVSFVLKSAEAPAEPADSRAGFQAVAEPNSILPMDFNGAPNFYEILQISSKADLETIHRVYRILAARFHPDNPVSGDHELFLKLGEAYEVLSDPDRRAVYDVALRARESEPIPLFGTRIFVDGLDGEMNRRFGVLALLYQRRRTNQGNLGISTLELENRMSLPREHIEFTLWYLRSKGYVQIQEDNSDYAISASGVDYVESHSSRNPILRELLTAGSQVAKQQPVTQPAKRSRRGESRRARRDGSIILA